MTSLGRERFVAEAWPLVGRKVSKARLINDIYETACSSMALPIAEGAVAISMFCMTIGQARDLIRERNRIEQIAQALLADHQDYQLLCKVPGIGPINALTILAEAGDLRRFRHHRQFLKVAVSILQPCSPAHSRDLPSYRSTETPGTPMMQIGGARL
jgi:hypothetical protein